MREIAGFSITNDRGNCIYQWKSSAKGMTGTDGAEKKIPAKKETEKESAKTAGTKKSSLTKKQMDGLATELKRTGVAMEAVKERYHIDDPRQMSEELYNKVMLALARTKSAA